MPIRHIIEGPITFVEQEAGPLARGLHSIMTSLIFSSMYIHIMKPLILNMSWAKSNSVWAVGWIVLAIIIIVAFLGYVLPLTQISYWGLIVFVKIINSIPYIGSPIAKMLLGGEFISGLTFSRVATLHIALPFILLLLVLFHMVMLHWNNSSDPLGFGGGQKTGQLLPLIWPPRHGRGPFHFQLDRNNSAPLHFYSISWRVLSVLQPFGHAWKNIARVVFPSSLWNY